MRYSLIILGFALMTRSLYGAFDFIPLQERAQGHSLVGAYLLNDSLYSNPAGSAFAQVYTVEGQYHMPKSYSVSVLDTRSSGIGGAFGYFRTPIGNSPDPLQGVKLSLMGKLSGAFALGLGGKILWGPNLQGVDTNLKDLDAGCLFRLDPLAAGITVRNILGGDGSLDQKQELTAGLRYGFQKSVFLSAAVHSEFAQLKPYQYGFGAEYVSPFYFAIKTGYRVLPGPGRNQSFWSGGLSFLAQKVNVHYAVEKALHGEGRVEHMVGTMLIL